MYSHWVTGDIFDGLESNDENKVTDAVIYFQSSFILLRNGDVAQFSMSYVDDFEIPGDPWVLLTPR